jgi:hypothetical protein
MSEDKMFPRKLEPVYFLEKIDTNLLLPYKEYFNTDVSKKNIRPQYFGHEPFTGSLWYPFPFMFRDTKFAHLYNLPHLNKLKEVYTLSIPLIEEIERISELKIVKLEINIMPPHTKIDTHVDKWGVLSKCCRIHIPIQTSPEVIFFANNEKYYIPEGQIFEFNNQIPHSVENKSDINRIHYVFDLVKEEDILEFEKEISTSLLLANSYFGNWKKSVRAEWRNV